MVPVFKENQFLIGVSVDGTEALHDRYRHDTAGNSTYERIKKNIELLEEYGVDYNILTVVTGQVAENIRDIYREYKKNGWWFQQYIACLDPFGEEPGSREYSLSPKQYGNFMIELFRMWDKDWRRGKAPYIRQFENYVGILLGYPPESCEQNGICSVQCVAEADGGAYPCDFYVMDEYRLGNYNENRIPEFLKIRLHMNLLKSRRNILRNVNSVSGMHYAEMDAGGIVFKKRTPVCTGIVSVRAIGCFSRNVGKE